MNRIFSAKSLLVAAVALGAVGAASAHTDVVFSVGVPAAYVAPAPVYVQPERVYVQREPTYVYPRSTYVDAQVVANHDWAWHHGRRYVAERRYGPWGDADRDGVPNRYDRAPFNPYRN